VTDATPLGGLNNLRSLDLSGTRVSDLAPLAALTGLQYLDLTNTPVTDLSPLAGLTELRWLIPRGTQTDIAVLAHLSGCQIVTAVTAPKRRAQPA
jgi:internalin A